MRRVVYASRATGEPGPAELAEILRVSRLHNAASGLTGTLLYSDGSFLQLLDGEPAAVQQTYTRIEQDPRHGDLRLLSDGPVPAALFPDWTMGFEVLDAAQLQQRLPGHVALSRQPLVDPAVVDDVAVARKLLGLYLRTAPR